MRRTGNPVRDYLHRHRRSVVDHRAAGRGAVAVGVVVLGRRGRARVRVERGASPWAALDGSDGSAWASMPGLDRPPWRLGLDSPVAPSTVRWSVAATAARTSGSSSGPMRGASARSRSDRGRAVPSRSTVQPTTFVEVRSLDADRTSASPRSGCRASRSGDRWCCRCSPRPGGPGRRGAASRSGPAHRVRRGRATLGPSATRSAAWPDGSCTPRSRPAWTGSCAWPGPPTSPMSPCACVPARSRARAAGPAGPSIDVGRAAPRCPDPRASALAAVDGDPGTTWIADPEDASPSLRVSWLGRERVTALRLRTDATSRRPPRHGYA